MEKFTLFDLEITDINVLKDLFKSIDGKNEYDFRTNIALNLMKEGKLENCPLFSENDESRINFRFLLSNTLEEIRNNDSLILSRKVSEYIWNQHRIIAIYAIWFEMSIIPLTDHEMYAKYPIKYDQGYFDELQRLSVDDLFEIVGNLSRGYIGHMTIYNIYKELAIRIYDDLDMLNYDNFSMENYMAISVYLIILSDERNDIIKKKRLKKLTYRFLVDYDEYDMNTDLHYNTIIFDLNPNRKNIEKLYKSLEVDDLSNFHESIMALILLSVSNSGQYPQISYETFVDIVRFLLEKYEGNCDNFFRMFMKKDEFRKNVSYIASALLRICGKNFSFSELALKGQIISHIPEGYYQ